MFGSRKEFVPLSSDQFVASLSIHCPIVSRLLVALLFVYFLFQMILDSDGRNPPPAASAASGAVNGIPGVAAAVQDPLQYGGLPVAVQIPGFIESRFLAAGAWGRAPTQKLRDCDRRVFAVRSCTAFIQVKQSKREPPIAVAACFTRISRDISTAICATSERNTYFELVSQTPSYFQRGPRQQLVQPHVKMQRS